MYLYSNNTPEGSLSERASVMYKHNTIMIGHQEVLPQLASKKVMAPLVSPDMEMKSCARDRRMAVSREEAICRHITRSCLELRCPTLHIHTPSSLTLPR